jgi:hypothetical protein
VSFAFTAVIRKKLLTAAKFPPTTLTNSPDKEENNPCFHRRRVKKDKTRLTASRESSRCRRQLEAARPSGVTGVSIHTISLYKNLADIICQFLL